MSQITNQITNQILKSQITRSPNQIKSQSQIIFTETCNF